MTASTPAVDETPGFPIRVIGIGVAATSMAIVPIHLVGVYGIQLRQEFGITTATLGYVTSAFFLVAALAAPIVGAFVQRRGWQTGVRMGPGVTGAALLAIVTIVHAPWALFVAIAIAGFGNAIGQTSANMLLADRATSRHHGLMFGIKQAAIPLSSVIIGSSVALFTGVLGWQWAFVAVAAVGAAVLTAGPRIALSEQRGVKLHPPASASSGSAERVPLDLPVMLLFALSAFFGSGITIALTVYLVDSAVTIGWSQAAGGLLLSVASALCLALRVGAGWFVDHRDSDPALAVSVLMILGGVGFLLLAFGEVSGVIFAAGGLVGIVAGWGWPGLMHFAVVRSSPRNVAAASGVALAGVFSGGVVLPTAFGTVVATWGYTPAWTSGAAVMVIGGVAMIAAARLARARRVAAGMH